MRGTSTCDPRKVVAGNLTLLSGQAVIFEDFVGEWLTQNGLAVDDGSDYTTSFIDISGADPNTDPLLVRAETYNATPTGNFGRRFRGSSRRSTGPRRRPEDPAAVF